MAKKADIEVEDKLKTARQNVEVLKIQMDENISVANEMAYSDEELERLLKKLPVVMFRQSQVVVLKFIDYKDCKRKVKKELALAMMKANQMKEELSSADDRKAWAQNDRSVEMAEIDLINAEAEYKMAEFHFQAYDNLYMAVKKMIDKRTAENAAQERASRT